MTDIPNDCRYTRSHEWLREHDDGSITIGITDYAQQQLGDLVYVELPETGRLVDEEEACAVVESVKAASDVFSPLAGEILETNDRLHDQPELVNQDPYGEGWLWRMHPGGDHPELLDADEYTDHLEHPEE